jgi:hypothetical protein
MIIPMYWWRPVETAVNLAPARLAGGRAASFADSIRGLATALGIHSRTATAHSYRTVGPDHSTRPADLAHTDTSRRVATSPFTS